MSPTLVIASPQQGSTILGSRVTVDFTVGELILTDYNRIPQNQSGKGHLHLWLDQPNATKNTAIQYFLVEPFTFERVPEGNHALIVEVVNNDHSSFDPPVSKIIDFKTVLPKSVKLQAITSPTPTPPLHRSGSFSQLALPFIFGLILINLGFLYWVWQKGTSSS